MPTTTLDMPVKKQQITVPSGLSAVAGGLELVGRYAVRYGLVIVLLWIGGMKFTAYEAESISGLVANSPIMSWAYRIFSTRQFSALIGAAELVIAGLIAARPMWPRFSALGSVLAGTSEAQFRQFNVASDFEAIQPDILGRTMLGHCLSLESLAKTRTTDSVRDLKNDDRIHSIHYSPGLATSDL